MIGIGSDHVALGMKEEIKGYLLAKGYEVHDFGTFGPERVDYCDYGFRVGEAVASGRCDRGLLFCGTGVGVSISANKVRGIRALVCSEPYSAKMSKEHNDTNVLALGARVVGIELAKMIVDAWLATEFMGGRYAARVNSIALFEQTRL